MLGKGRMFLVALVQAVFTQISSVRNPVMNTGALEEQTLGPVCRRRKHCPIMVAGGRDSPLMRW